MVAADGIGDPHYIWGMMMPPQPLGNRLPNVGNTAIDTLYTQTASGLIPYGDVGTNTLTKISREQCSGVLVGLHQQGDELDFGASAS